MNINETYEYLKDTIFLAAEKSIPKTSTNISKTVVPWWNLQIEEAIRDIKGIARQLVKKAKKESWQSFTASINRNTTPTTVWKSIRNICGKPWQEQIKVINVNNQNITTVEGIVSSVGKHIANTSSSSNYTISFSLNFFSRIWKEYVFTEKGREAIVPIF